MVEVVRVALVALFTTVTVTPGTTAPVESFTSPVMVPSVCAKQECAEEQRRQSHKQSPAHEEAPFGYEVGDALLENSPKSLARARWRPRAADARSGTPIAPDANPTPKRNVTDQGPTADQNKAGLRAE